MPNAERSSTLRPARRLALALGSLLIAAACGDSGETADAEGGERSTTVTVYSGRNPELIGPLMQQFEKDTGVNVELRGGDSGELAAQILTEGDASPADLFFSQDAGALGALEKGGRLAKLPDGLLEKVDRRFRDPDGRWVGTSGRSRVIVYNPGLVSDASTSIDALVDPQWKGKVGFAPTNASWQAFVTALRVAKGDGAARDWLERFAANEPKTYENNAALRDAVDAGEVAMGPSNHYYLYEKIAEEGADKVAARNAYLKGGDPGALINVAGVGVLAKADNADAARRLAEFLLSEKGQRFFAEETFEYPLVRGVAASPEIPPLAQLEPPDIDLADLDALDATQEMLAEVGLLSR